MKEVVLRLSDVSFSNNGTPILKSASLEIERNTLTTVLGRSGSGKSSLIKIMAGIFVPDSGVVEIQGQDFYRQKEKEKINIRKKVSFVFQNAALISNLSIKENLMLPLNFHYPKMPLKERNDLIERMLTQVDMLKSINGRPAQLSVGEKKLIGIARALITKPEILFLDEPLGSLDASVSCKLLDVIHSYSLHQWSTIVAVTYSKEIITGIGTHIILLEDHMIKFNLTKEKVINMQDFEKPEIIAKMFSDYKVREEE